MDDDFLFWEIKNFHWIMFQWKLISKLLLENNILQELFIDDQYWYIYKYFNEIDVVWK